MNQLTPESQKNASIKIPRFTLEDANAIQCILMEGKDPLAWIEAYAERFREIIDTNPELYRLFESDPEVCIEEIRRRLEHPTIH
jgi:hypothetical protein